ncbi:MAG: hypothetical protein A2Y39_00470 [Candidatus Delongbacteria bacterium GWF2_40_14]|nr:MAG: hypothetical protein A2Y39_00470 [Candidatus Delongbacteria bacterium GWF2_40_14]
MFKFGDLIIYAAVLSAALFPFFREKESENNKIQVIHDKHTEYFDAGKDTVFFIQGNKVEIEIKDRKVRIKNSDCRDKYCVKHGWLKEDQNGKIICMPNKVIIEFIKQDDDVIDAVTE